MEYHPSLTCDEKLALAAMNWPTPRRRGPRSNLRKLKGGLEAYHLRRNRTNAAYVARHGITNPRYRFRHARPKQRSMQVLGKLHEQS
jgi:hypothetical protein